MIRWDTRLAEFNTDEEERLLNDGWEPIGVVVLTETEDLERKGENTVMVLFRIVAKGL